MKCSKCNTDFDITIPEMNVFTYGGEVVYTCPKCHKPYKFSRMLSLKVEECYSDADCDDWGGRIVNDGKRKDYNEYWGTRNAKII
jgi:DNA-directed RNA polymerase subunit RPC12/RpoP